MSSSRLSEDIELNEHKNSPILSMNFLMTRIFFFQINFIFIIIQINNLLKRIHVNFHNKFYPDLYLIDNKVHKNDHVPYSLVDEELDKIEAIDNIH